MPKRHFDAQWNDDIHHALHVLLTGEHQGYYEGYIQNATEKLARALAEGFIYQGEPSPYREGEPRGEPSAHLPPTSFVAFLQNHDQVGNRAFGERLTTLAKPQALRAASALLLLSPQIPLLFMGEEYGATQPFLYFTSYLQEDLANAVREGRRQEFARFPAFSDPQKRAQIPDPNAEQTFLDSIPHPDSAKAELWRDWVKAMLTIRREQIMPRLKGAKPVGAEVLGASAVKARWRMRDGKVLMIAVNLGDRPVSVSMNKLVDGRGGTILFETDSVPDALPDGTLPPHAFIAVLEPAA
jgi:maltooligosyltrehalose trehalohydrolase